MKYQWVLFDADETLFSFNSYLGLKAIFSRENIDFSIEDYNAFQAVNQPLWVQYQNKEITAEELQRIRFEKLSQKTGKDPRVLNQELMEEMAVVSQPLEHVQTMLEALSHKVKMAIISNGFESLQHKRLVNTNTLHFFDIVMTSERAGIAKPDPLIFEAVFDQMGKVDLNRVLMVGDTLSSDIQGGINVGIDTCWYNPEEKLNELNIKPTYEIRSMLELIDIVDNKVKP
ncbi:noncanonical pyrimidine nucleotidase, YjjG family [Vespertiliibacter pulmonis]|uniref:Putative hydrolase of the HAD superfamily n=1 Tax=Vespertiliibacter pulmonis TaxID=1443036 RepID=A0A3N4VY48_9PAST|nr:pyrimidine 5'-nucleotidase [Vespertiliibacter pulmonis]QLB20153.1 noncanonical pyrimidine nucleotidase, YjjG family [Vespertiliibacter pulmonis]RPE86125.1 putative hydrolase of the HAD superfamily [Vespertiliibacter pulmonis]